MNTTNNSQTLATGGDLLDAKISGYAKSYAYTAIFNMLLVLLKENVHPVFKLMASLGHHWVTHGVLVLLVYFALGKFFTSQNKQMTGLQAINHLIWGTIIGGGIIALFNLWNTI